MLYCNWDLPCFAYQLTAADSASLQPLNSRFDHRYPFFTVRGSTVPRASAGRAEPRDQIDSVRLAALIDGNTSAGQRRPRHSLLGTGVARLGTSNVAAPARSGDHVNSVFSTTMSERHLIGNPCSHLLRLGTLSRLTFSLTQINRSTRSGAAFGSTGGPLAMLPCCSYS